MNAIAISAKTTLRRVTAGALASLALLSCGRSPPKALLDEYGHVEYAQFDSPIHGDPVHTVHGLDLLRTDMDLDRGVLILDQNKTNDPRSWSMDPGVVRALRVWKTNFAGSTKPTSKIIADRLGNVIDPYTAASNLRDYLKLAGERAQLFESNDQRIALRANDLRATFVTTSLANGKTEAWVCDRTGHRSSQMLYCYRRQARMYADLNLGELTPLDQVIPELRPMAEAHG